MLEIINTYINQLERERCIRVYMPEGYNQNPERRYPVIYMHDGQNLFDRTTSAYGYIWNADRVIEDLMYRDGFIGAIIVGIDNMQSIERMDEYSPWVSERVEEMNNSGMERDVGGKGDLYARYIIENLKPQIDRDYRTLPDSNNTIIAGSSMGGLISLYIGVKYPHIFARVCAMSTASWFAQTALNDFIKSFDTSYKTKWYLDIGTNEADNPLYNSLYIDGTNRVASILREIGVDESNIHIKVEEGAIHNECAWSRRFPDSIKWLFQDQPDLWGYKL